MTLLFVAAPALTVSTVLLLLSNTATWLKFLLHYRRDMFVFSALNAVRTPGKASTPSGFTPAWT